MRPNIVSLLSINSILALHWREDKGEGGLDKTLTPARAIKTTSGTYA